MMVTQEQAENLAKKAMESYVNNCHCQTTEDVANVLMKLASVCSVAMVAVAGHSDAVARLQGVTDYIDTKVKKTAWKCEKSH